MLNLNEELLGMADGAGRKDGEVKIKHDKYVCSKIWSNLSFLCQEFDVKIDATHKNPLE